MDLATPHTTEKLVGVFIRRESALSRGTSHQICDLVHLYSFFLACNMVPSVLPPPRLTLIRTYIQSQITLCIHSNEWCADYHALVHSSRRSSEVKWAQDTSEEIGQAKDTKVHVTL